MPGVDFDVVRREITMQQVLDEIGFEVTHQEGGQLRGPCLVHGSTPKTSRVFSVNLSTQRYYCPSANHMATNLSSMRPYARRRSTAPPSICVTRWAKTCHGSADGEPSDRHGNREEAPVLEVPKSVAYKKTDPQLLTISRPPSRYSRSSRLVWQTRQRFGYAIRR